MRSITNEEMELSISNMLRFGIILSALVVFCGGLLYLKNTPATPPPYATFRPEISSLRSVRGTLLGSAHLDPESVIQLGILLLIATPVTRVAFCIMGFVKQRDHLYIGISSAVFLILMYSMIQGGR